jgi:hypothetical protein
VEQEDAAITRQRHGKRVSAAKNEHTRTEDNPTQQSKGSHTPERSQVAVAMKVFSHQQRDGSDQFE